MKTAMSRKTLLFNLAGQCPAEFSSSPNQTHLKQLIKVLLGILETSRQVCWCKLELNSAGHRLSRTECGDPWSNVRCSKRHICNACWKSNRKAEQSNAKCILCEWPSTVPNLQCCYLLPKLICCSFETLHSATVIDLTSSQHLSQCFHKIWIFNQWVPKAMDKLVTRTQTHQGKRNQPFQLKQCISTHNTIT